MLGATTYLHFLQLLYNVSILSQLRCWEQRRTAAILRWGACVSILSQLRCWEQLWGGGVDVRACKVSILSQLRCWEQPLSLIAILTGHMHVSILSQLRCWEQRINSSFRLDPDVFQSSPSLGAGSNATALALCWAAVKFQSSPSLGAGSNL